jgi:histidine ammonia-lyase
MSRINIVAGELTLNQLKICFDDSKTNIDFSFDKNKIQQSKNVVDKICSEPDKIVYGINTGFGKLHDKHISSENLQQLQKNLIISHATGVDDKLPKHIVKIILLLKINALAQGYSGVRLDLINALDTFLQNDAFPLVPSKGSVGASGDLAPLSHLVLPLLGMGEVEFDNKILPAHHALEALNIEQLELDPKEGLALINGTQVSLSLLLDAYFKAIKLFDSVLLSCSMTMIASKARKNFLDARIHKVRRMPGQIAVAECIEKILQDCDWKVPANKVQDPYSIRCMPQVLGACKEQLDYIGNILTNEINAVTDNPLVFADSQEILSGGNFHAEPIAFAADALANVLAELSNTSERRIAMLMDPSFSGLPAFLMPNSGINSGFMNLHVTASALASENKAQCFPRSVDTIPTSMNQEDHVSMATNAALRLQEICKNTQNIISIEVLSAIQGMRFNNDLKINGKIKEIFQSIGETIPFFDCDSYFSPYIEQISHAINENMFVLSKKYGCTMKGRDFI